MLQTVYTNKILALKIIVPTPTIRVTVLVVLMASQFWCYYFSCNVYF